MKTKYVTIAAFSLIAGMGSLSAAVTIAFNAAFTGGVSANLANSAGVATNNMFYGILIGSVDPAGYLPVTASLGGAVNLISATTSLPSGTWMYFASDKTADSSGLLEGDFSTPGGNGSVQGIINLPLVSPALATAAFKLFWIDPSGGVAGLLSDASFVLPPDGSTVTIDAPYVGIDPIRRAGLAYSGTSGVSTGPGVTFIPEPSAALLGALGALGLLRRRRN